MSSVFNTIFKPAEFIIKQAVTRAIGSWNVYTTGAIVSNIIITPDLHMCTLEEAKANHRWPSFKLIHTSIAAIHEHWWY
ncbi:hypothetical protein F5I97DRAFT_1932036 [Phlebopus sp. FC_14]|nr:hypothetical protein F5I97DRAFT_1932036 [Phlebopus sp. FC_14]